ncbi:MAG TPA: response regulator [Allosphingosinicella sp.]|jgi:CheY-like chemotaxis protein
MTRKGTLTCTLRGHAPDAEQIVNKGLVFARCRRCGADMVRKAGRWHAVPKGYRIAWPQAAAPAEAPPPSPPLAAVPAPTPPPPLPPQVVAGPSAAAATVLVCDDDPLILDLLEHRLSGRGYRVVLARDGREGLARTAECRPDAIVLDAMMPTVDGYEMLRRLREEEETRRVPVIMLTARRSERDVVGALELGADDFISKPFIPEELLSRLARLLAEERV